MPISPQRFGFTKRKLWAGKTATKRLITGYALQRERSLLFANEPYCRECMRHGIARRPTIRDHIKPLAFGGKDESANTQPLCKECHDEKTKQESKDGSRFAMGCR